MQVEGIQIHFTKTSLNRLNSESKFSFFPRANWELPIGEAYFVRFPYEEDQRKFELEDEEHKKVRFWRILSNVGFLRPKELNSSNLKLNFLGKAVD